MKGLDKKRKNKKGIALITVLGMLTSVSFPSFAGSGSVNLGAASKFADSANGCQVLAKLQAPVKLWAINQVIRTDVKYLKAGTRVEQQKIRKNGVDAYFFSEGISDSLFQRMYGKSYKENCTIPREDLRYLKMLYCGLDGESYVGEMVCHKEISQEVLAIFRELYDNAYPIEKMVLVDDYDGDNLRSAADNNTSCFNFRIAEGTSGNLSFHASGMAVDVNPLYNPYRWTDYEGNARCDPEEGWEYADRTKEFPYKIQEDDLCRKVFEEHGFFWGGSWVNEKDYMHFSFKKKG